MNEWPACSTVCALPAVTGLSSGAWPQIAKTDLLILDDFALKPLAQSERHDLLEIIEDRHAGRSTLVTSQLPIARWHEYLAEPTVADALLDRLLHNAFKIELKGESMRKTKPPLT